MKIDLSLLRRSPAWLRVFAFALLLVLLWLPIALPMYWLIRDRNLVNILTLLVLYVEFIWLVRRWGSSVHRESHILWHYGLELTPRLGRDLLIGIGIGVASVAILMSLQTLLGWVSWKVPASSFPVVVLGGLFVSLALGFAEELLFRGWLLDELQRDYAPTLVLWANAILFAILHLRWLTFPALVLFGMALVWAKRSRGEWVLGKRRDRLGLPWGLHAGLVWGNYSLEVGKLITYTGTVPDWVTGIDQNPLAGLVGIGFMGILAIAMGVLAQRRSLGWKG